MSNQQQEAHQHKRGEQVRQHPARAGLLTHMNVQYLTPNLACGLDSTQHVVLLRCAEVQVRTGLSRSSVYARMNQSDPAYDGSFPLPVNVSAKSSVSNRWIAHEVDAWIASRPRTRAFTDRVAGHV